MLKAIAMSVALLLAAGSAALAEGHRTKAPEGAEVYIISPADGATVSNPVTVRFGLKGMGVAPAGVEQANTGHHHLLIDTKLEDYDNPIPSDDKHRHFGGGQTEVTVDLPAGKHSLQLLVGDRNHVPHLPPIESKTISINVQ